MELSKEAQAVIKVAKEAEEHTCPSCGIEYIHHLGLIGTCKKLQIAIETFHSLLDYQISEEALNKIMNTLEQIQE